MKQSPVRLPYEPVEVDQPKPNRRVLSKIRTRQKVLEAARVLFAERGYEAATIRDIAHTAGMSTGAVFANFEDKADLFESILAEDSDLVAERMGQASESGGTTSERLVSAFSASYAYYLGNLPLLQATLAQSWLRPLSAELRSRTATMVLLSIVSDVLRDGVRHGELQESIDVRMVSELLWDVHVANYRRAVYDGGDIDLLRARLSDQVGLILAGLRK
jgi:AcrR family transcriptional regulator